MPRTRREPTSERENAGQNGLLWRRLSLLRRCRAGQGVLRALEGQIRLTRVLPGFGRCGGSLGRPQQRRCRCPGRNRELNGFAQRHCHARPVNDGPIEHRRDRTYGIDSSVKDGCRLQSRCGRAAYRQGGSASLEELHASAQPLETPGVLTLQARVRSRARATTGCTGRPDSSHSRGLRGAGSFSNCKSASGKANQSTTSRGKRSSGSALSTEAKPGMTRRRSNWDSAASQRRAQIPIT